MNYRHIYHAGNFADVLKHLVLVLVIQHLKLKPAPFRVIDTHAGIGRYDLTSAAAQKTGEWTGGIGRLLAAELPAPSAAILAPYLDLVRAENSGDGLAVYPGSPLLARRLLRPDDRLVANELHPEDGAELEALFQRDRQAKVLHLDGWTALKALLPPKERRGVMLIDPPFEEPGELERMTAGLHEALRRFETGTVILWYPIKALAPIDRFHAALKGLGLDKLLVVELFIRPPDDGERLNGTGLVVINPPYTLEGQLRTVLPVLSRLLSDGSADGLGAPTALSNRLPVART